MTLNETTKKLDDILENSKKLLIGEEVKLQKDLYTINEISNRLTKSISKTTNSTGEYMLAVKGHNVEKHKAILSNLEKMETIKEVKEEVSETDMEGKLKQEYDVTILDTIEETKNIVK
jgi:hypothetical protein